MNNLGEPPIIETIGVPQPLVDGPEKATGKAKFAADFNTTETLVGRILRSPFEFDRDDWREFPRRPF